MTPDAEDTTETNTRSVEVLPEVQSGPEGAGQVAPVTSEHDKVFRGGAAQWTDGAPFKGFAMTTAHCAA